MKKWMAILLISAFYFTACNKNNIPQDNTPVEQVIDSREYAFKAETANPMGGTSVRLSYGYDLVIKPRELTATLPYYGRAYTADRNFGGIRFTSTKFSYKSVLNDQGGWDILVKTNDVPEVQELRLNVSRDGYATLYITSTNRQPISYYGTIQKM